MKGLIFLTILTIQTFKLHTPPRRLWLHTGPKTRAKPTTTGRRIWPCSPAEAGWAGAVIAVSCTEWLTLVPTRACSTGGTAWIGGLLASQHSHHPPTTLQSSLSSSHHGRVQTERPKICQTAVGAASQPTTAATKCSKTITKSCCTIVLPISMFGFSVRDVNADTLDDEVLSTERLGNLQQRHESGHRGTSTMNSSVRVYYWTWSSANVTKAKARNGLGMKTSVTSPYCMKNCLRSSVVISSVQRPTNTFRLLNGSSKGCCFFKDGKSKHCRLENFQQIWKTWMRKYCEDICMDITIFTFELGNLQSHHLPSIMWRCEITFSWASYSANLTKPKPLELPVLPSRFTWNLENK